MSWMIPIFGTETSVDDQKTVNPDQGMKGTAASVKAELFNRATLQDVHLSALMSRYSRHAPTLKQIHYGKSPCYAHGKVDTNFCTQLHLFSIYLYIYRMHPEQRWRDFCKDELKTKCLRWSQNMQDVLCWRMRQFSHFAVNLTNTLCKYKFMLIFAITKITIGSWV